jgi:hypothetical protein
MARVMPPHHLCQVSPRHARASTMAAASCRRHQIAGVSRSSTEAIWRRGKQSTNPFRWINRASHGVWTQPVAWLEVVRVSRSAATTVAVTPSSRSHQSSRVRVRSSAWERVRGSTGSVRTEPVWSDPNGLTSWPRRYFWHFP